MNTEDMQALGLIAEQPVDITSHFDGEQARRIMRHPAFSAEQPVHSIGADESILRLLLEISEATQTQLPGFEQIIATQASQIVASLLARLQYSSPEDHDMETRIRRACLHISQHAEQTIDTSQLSRDLGISHSAFRNQFKQDTGLPPSQYQIQIRLNKARRLLRNSTLSIQEIPNSSASVRSTTSPACSKRKPAAHRSPTASRFNSQPPHSNQPQST